MSFILDANNVEDLNEFLSLYNRYYEYLESVKEKIPVATYSFATAPWHYNHDDPRCPHDGWLETIRIHEPSLGERQQIRSINIFMRLLNSFHNGYIEFEYINVKSYSIHKLLKNYEDSHGDYLLDEVRLSENDFVLHEIAFENCRILIECEDILYSWKPFANPKLA